MTEFRNSKQKSMVGQAPPNEDYKVKRKKAGVRIQKTEGRRQRISNIEVRDCFGQINLASQ